MSFKISSRGVGLSFCVRRLGPFSKCVLRPEAIIFGVLRPATFWRLRPRPNFYGVLRLTVFWRLTSGVWSQNSGVWRPGFPKNNRVSYSSASASWNDYFRRLASWAISFWRPASYRTSKSDPLHEVGINGEEIEVLFSFANVTLTRKNMFSYTG